ncbi:MAG TPA: acetate kinase [Clostridia bacterium]|jgi:acetate kinase|nr:acetate kinase [Clostridia bacterium]
MKILVVNAGSSSIKYQIIDADNENTIGKGIVDRIGLEGSSIKQECQNGKKLIKKADLKDHTAAFELVIKSLVDPEYGIIKSMDEIMAIGHRVLHSAEDFSESVLVTLDVLKICKRNAPLGELHMPANISCMAICMKLMPKTPNIAVFDTSFHLTMPPHAYMYAIKYEDYEMYQLRRYGFHGTSHRYVSGEAIKYLDNKKDSKIITCHLGNGSSLAAIRDGKCIDTTMGLTPLEGLVMGTRSGDIDPAAIAYLAKKKNQTAEEVVTYLNKECGFLGVCGYSDNRDVVEKARGGDYHAQLACNMFAYRIKKYIGAYTAALGGLDCIVFTGGIGENSVSSRKDIMQGLEAFGVYFDYAKNEEVKGKFADLTAENSRVKVLVIPTNEELVIARDAKRIALENKR